MSGRMREILVCDEGNLPLLAGYVQQGLQNNLSIYTTLVRLPRKELLERVAAGDYQAAILPLTVSYSSPDSPDDETAGGTRTLVVRRFSVR